MVTQASIFIVLMAQADGGGLDNVLTSSNFPGIILLSASGVVGMIFIMRHLIRFSREFTQFYMEENQKLRGEVEELKDELKSKDEALADANRALDEHKRDNMYKIAELEIRLADQDSHIKRLNRIIERRKLTEEDT